MKPRRDLILALVAKEYRFPVAHIVSKIRYPIYVQARATFAHAARSFGHTLERIAETANRDRATVQYWLKKHPETLPKLSAVMSRLTKQEAA